jgi:zinc protease
MTRKIKNASMTTMGALLLTLCVTMFGPDAFALPPVERTVLPNGLVVLVCVEPSLPVVTIRLLTEGGSRRDPSGREGLAHLTARGLLLGTSKRKAVTINEELDFMGASLFTGADQDYAAITLRVLKKDLDKGFDLFMEILTQPTFPDEEIRREIEKTLAAIHASEDEPGDVAERAFKKALFSSGPYGHSVEGTKESVQGITRDDLVSFHRTFYRPNKSILVAVGDVKPEEFKTRLLPALTAWSKADIPGMPAQTPLEKGPKQVKIDRPITQANIILGHEGVARGTPDYYTLTVMNYILGGGGLTSRLMEEIRNRRGLAYSVGSFFDPGKDPGSFQIFLQTKNGSAREATSLSLKEMDRIRQELVSEKELEGAKKYLIGSFPMRFDTQAKLSQFLSQVEFYGLGLDYAEKYPSLIRSITREEILRVARIYLHPDRTILVVVANLKEAGMD